MEADYSMLIGLISVVCGAGVIGLSYLGAYLIGHSRGRREAELDRQIAEQDSRLGDQRASTRSSTPCPRWPRPSSASPTPSASRSSTGCECRSRDRREWRGTIRRRDITTTPVVSSEYW